MTGYIICIIGFTRTTTAKTPASSSSTTAQERQGGGGGVSDINGGRSNEVEV
jgi:hypothetical protein